MLCNHQATAYAQRPNKYALVLSGGAGLPLQELITNQGIGFGANADFIYLLSKTVGLSFNTGYYSFAGKTTTASVQQQTQTIKTNSAGFVPARAGLVLIVDNSFHGNKSTRVILDNSFRFNVSAGLAGILDDSFHPVASVSILDNSFHTGFGYRAGIAKSIGRLDIAASSEGASISGANVGFTLVRAGIIS